MIKSDELCLKLQDSQHLEEVRELEDGICRFTIKDLGLDVEVFESVDGYQLLLYVKGIDEDNMSWEHGCVSVDELLDAVCSDTLNEDLFFM